MLTTRRIDGDSRNLRPGDLNDAGAVLHKSCSSPKPIAITMGDMAGIGPEIVAQLFRLPEVSSNCVVVGDLEVMRRAALITGGLLAVTALDDLAQLAHVPPRCIPVWQAPDLPPDLLQVPWGQVDARAGLAAARCIEAAVRGIQQNQFSSVVTAPIHKKALSNAGIPWPGHTEMLQALASPGTTPPPVRMMLTNPDLRVVLVTVHLALRDAIAALSLENILQTLRITHHSAHLWGQSLGHTPLRMAVAGLNPHAGEDGLFGDEEQKIIAPAIAAARAEGIDARGPFAPDTVFMRARNTQAHPGEFDVVVAMTHDHGLIPIKYLGIENGVNATLGLPFVRTSPDHGAAFDIAGQGRADASSLTAAVRLAREWVGQ
jgi:4-hydroxythreonine-4-phosphate dehydrogenase